MFVTERRDVETVLRDYGIRAEIKEIAELQRYHYERYDPDSKEVRLIVKISLETAPPLVIRFKNEADVTRELIESQCRFAEVMRQNGIATPPQYRTDGRFAKWYHIGEYDVIVTVEQFAENQLKLVDARTAEKTGALLAKMHNISEQNGLHVDNAVLFDPFAANDLFAYDDFQALGQQLQGDERVLFDRIVEKYNEYMELLSPLRACPRYAVQGDISDCNLYLAAPEEIGIFDFNRCGDNVLFCDAAMQAIFEARLMSYPENRGENWEDELLRAFWRGYCSVRAVSEEEWRLYAYLYAIVHAFWSQDIIWREDSLLNAHKAGDRETVRRRLGDIWQRLNELNDVTCRS